MSRTVYSVTKRGQSDSSSCVSIHCVKPLILFIIVILMCAIPIESFAAAIITQPVTTAFGTYIPEIRPYIPSVAPYSIPDSLKGVLFADSYTFSDSARAMLIKNGFVAVAANAQSMTAIYKATNDQKLPSFVTTDAVLQTFYKIYDKMLTIAEYNRFYAQLDSLLHGMLSGISSLRAQYTGNDSVGLALTRDAAYVDVAHTLLTDTMTFAIDTAVRTIVAAETSMVYQHQGFFYSKVIPDLEEDFSQYVPRGHYTLDKKLEHYFRAMMYLGRMNMRITSRIETMQACILSRVLATAVFGSDSASSLWAAIYNPTTFIVGRSDDLNYHQYADVLDRVIENQWRSGDMELIYSNLSAIIQELNKLPKPLILSGLDSTPGFHVMGQRFVPDSYMFGQLVYEYVGTDADPRLFPRGLDVPAVLGSQRARKILTDLYHDDRYVNYTKQLDSLSAKFNAFPPSQWADNLYWTWLYALIPYLQTPGKGYPFFMTTQAWADKSLMSFSGSWAELRHATILYAKQSYTSPTSIDCPLYISFPQGYVEPNPDILGRIASMTALMKSGFNSVGLASICPLNKLDRLYSLSKELQDIAIAQLQGTQISINGYCGIATAYQILDSIENFKQYAVVSPNGSIDSSVACIVDVHTDPNSANVLEVGTGKPMCLYVIAPVEGRLQVCRGAIFSYYEFQHPMNDRLTDAQWQTMLATTPPSMPEWIGSFASSKEKSLYRVSMEDLTQCLSASDSVPMFFHAGDSVILSLVSDSSASLSVDSKNSQHVFQGNRILLPPEILGDTNVLTINIYKTGPSTTYCFPSIKIPVSYRRILIKSNSDPIHSSRQEIPTHNEPRIVKGRVVLPTGNAWRVVDVRGRQVAYIGPQTRAWTAPRRFAHTVLILEALNKSLFHPLRFVSGD